MEIDKPNKIEISHRTIIFTVFFLISLWFLFLIREIVAQFFAAILIMAILNPFVVRLAKYKIPRGLSILLVYIIVITLISVSVAGVLPPLVDQSTKFINNFNYYVSYLQLPGEVTKRALNEIVNGLVTLPGQIARIGVSLISNIFSILTVLVFAFYLLLSRDKLDEQLGVFFGEKAKTTIARILDLLETRLGGWVRGEISLMTLIGLSTYIGLILIGIPFALPLAILAGLLEIVPYFGPLLSAVPAVIIGLGMSPLVGLAAAGLYFLVQQLENYIFVPKVMQKTAGVSPLITLLALSIGFKLAGIGGVLMSVPFVIMIHEIIKEYLLKK